MAKDTSRDRIWQYALQRVLQDDPVLVEDVVEDVGVSKRTARDALNSAAQTNFLDRNDAPDGTARFVRPPYLLDALEE